MRYILVHGVAHGAWCWEKIAPRLEELGHEVTVLDLPLTSHDADAEAVAGVIGDGDAPILVGHSYGGAVISTAAARAKAPVKHLVYLAALMLAPDEEFELQPTHMTQHLVLNDDGTFEIAAAEAPTAFYHMCPDENASFATSQLRPTSLTCIAPDNERFAPWTSVPSTYVICSQDKALAPESQVKMSSKANHVVTFDTDHSPFYSMPAALVSLLTDIKV